MFIFSQGAVDATISFRLRSLTTGQTQQGLAFDSPGAQCSFVRPRGNPVAITLNQLVPNLPDAPHLDGGFIEIGGTHPGTYRLDLPDAAIASGESWVQVSLSFTGIINETQIVLLNPEPNIVSGVVVADGGNAADSFRTNLPSTQDDDYQEAWIVFRSGVLALTGPRKCVSYTGSNQFVTVLPAFTSTPVAGTEFVLINR